MIEIVIDANNLVLEAMNFPSAGWFLSLATKLLTLHELETPVKSEVLFQNF
jgi:hypothetical protein